MSQFARLLAQCLLISIVLAAPPQNSVRQLPQLGARQIDDRKSSSSSHIATPSTTSPSTINTAPSVTTIVSETATDAPAPEIANTMAWSPITGNADNSYEPIRGALGGTILGPTNNLIASQNPDIIAPPTTDHGVVPNAKWPFSLSRNRLQTGGWARQQNINDMPIATQMSGVNMRLEAGAIRELHWHTAAEWAYILSGSTQITAITPEGNNYIATVNQGDLWYFPSGVPHSLQATGADPNGTEFLLVFDTGDFDEDETFLLTDWMAQVPKEVLALNFGVDQSAFNNIPAKELYIFPGNLPESDAAERASVVSPYGPSPTPFTYSLSTMNATQLAGGSIKIVDSTTFSVSKTIAVAEVTVNPGGMRELHWHPDQDEWTYYLSGTARVSLFASGQNARTFDYQAGDIGYVPATFGHYIQNVGTEPLKFLEIFKTPKFKDVSLAQWLALIPAELVQAHLGISNATIASFSKTKQTVVAGPAAPQQQNTTTTS